MKKKMTTGKTGDLPTGDVCFYRPERTTQRRYTEKDVARIYCLAIKQGSSRAEIDKLIQQSCPPDKIGECSCSELYTELKQALEMAAYVLAIIAMVVPMARVIRLLITIAGPAIQKALKNEAETSAKQLEDLSGQQPIIEGEFQRIDELMNNVLSRMEGSVVIKP